MKDNQNYRHLAIKVNAMKRIMIVSLVFLSFVIPILQASSSFNWNKYYPHLGGAAGATLGGLGTYLGAKDYIPEQYRIPAALGGATAAGLIGYAGGKLAARYQQQPQQQPQQQQPQQQKQPQRPLKGIFDTERNKLKSMYTENLENEPVYKYNLLSESLSKISGTIAHTMIIFNFHMPNSPPSDDPRIFFKNIKDSVKSYLWEAYIIFCKYPEDHDFQSLIPQLAEFFKLDIQSEKDIGNYIKKLKQSITNQYGAMPIEQAIEHFNEAINFINRTFQDPAQKLQAYKRLLQQTLNFTKYHFADIAMQIALKIVDPMNNPMYQFKIAIADKITKEISALERQIKDQN